MSWDYKTLQAADAALNIQDESAAAAAINAQTITLMQQDTSIVTMQQILLSSVAGDWAKIVARSRMQLSNTAVDIAILSAINAVELVSSAQSGVLTHVQTSVNEVATAFNNSLSALQASGDITQDSVNAILALQTIVEKTWIPEVTAGDIQTARTQGV